MDLSGLHYNIAVTMFFVTYGLFEVPSNIVLKMWRPSYWIAVLMFCWGLVMTLMGIVQTIHGLYIARFFLGIGAGGVYPLAAAMASEASGQVSSYMFVCFCVCGVW